LLHLRPTSRGLQPTPRPSIKCRGIQSQAPLYQVTCKTRSVDKQEDAKSTIV
jgi:hypothetical protein